MPVAGEFVYNLGNGLLTTTALPLLGTNPAGAKERPPLRPDVPCETQPVPNLKTKPGPPPQQMQSAATANPDAYKKLWDDLSQKAVGELRDAVDRAGLDKQLKVSSDPATAADIAGLASKLGNTAQMQKIIDMVKAVAPDGSGK
jgi:hypothetical protein